MDDSQRDLEDAVEELSETLTDLRAELREPPTGPLGLPRPPTPGEVLRFTEQYTLPALISLLETSIRMLELLSASIRLVQDGPIDPDRPPSSRDDGDRWDRLASVGRTTLEALDEALAELQTAAPSAQPAGPEVQRLLEEARDLGAEVDARLADATTDRTGREVHEIDVQKGRDGGDADDGLQDPRGTGRDGKGDVSAVSGDETADVDVDAELESIKDELDGREQPGEAHGATEEPLEGSGDESEGDGDSSDPDGSRDDSDR